MKKFIICFWFLLIFLLPANMVQAEEQIDLDKIGSIDITLRDTDGNIVNDGTIAACKVADVYYDNQGYKYVYTEPFVDSEYSLDKSSIPELAKELHEYAIENEIVSDVYNNTDGKIKIENLTVGLYLISQQTASAGYSEIVPFLVSLPYQLDGILEYEVDASPKLSPVDQEIIEPETTTEEETESENESQPGTENGTDTGTENENETETETQEKNPEGTGGINTGDKISIMIYGCLMCVSILIVGIGLALKNTKEEKKTTKDNKIK